LKPENLLLDEKNNIKIVDFGLGNLYQEGQLLQTACGSPCYAAPEMIAGKKYKGVETDVWSSGIILFAMICGYLPFEDKNTPKLYDKIMKGDFIIPSHVSNEAKDLMEKLLTVDPKARLPINKIKTHNWFTNLKIKVFGKEEILKSANLMQEGNITVNINLNEEVLDKMMRLNEKKEYIEKCLFDDKHNHITASYYLFLKQLEKEKKMQEIIMKNENEKSDGKNIKNDKNVKNDKYDKNEKNDKNDKNEKNEKSEKNEKTQGKLNDLLKKVTIKNNYFQNGYSTNQERIYKNKENIPKSFDISFNTNKNNHAYIFEDALKQNNQIDFNKNFRIKSSINPRPPILMNKYISSILKHSLLIEKRKIMRKSPISKRSIKGLNRYNRSSRK